MKGNKLKKLDFQTILEKVDLEPVLKIRDYNQSMRLEKSVSKMDFVTPRCWAINYFIQKYCNFEEMFDFRGCGFFEYSKIWR